MRDSARRIFYPVFSRILGRLLIAHETIMGDILSIWAYLRFYHYFSVTAIGGFCDGIHGVSQGIAGGDNGT